MKAALSGMEQESLLYQLYQSLPIGVAFLSSHGEILSANRQFCKYFSGSAEGPHGLPVLAQVSVATKTKVLAPVTCARPRMAL